jgi:hypothetical protein
MTANFEVETPTPSNFSPPSVPLSLYRELVEDLELAQARIEFLTAQNKDFVKENQQLRQELERAICYVQQMQAAIENAKVPSRPPVLIDEKKQIIEIESDRDRYAPQSKSDGAINGWVLAIALLLIIVTSCLGAFLIVSSRLGNHK